MGEGVLALNFAYLQEGRVEQFSRVCFRLSGVGSRVKRSRIYFQNSCAASDLFWANHLSLSES